MNTPNEDTPQANTRASQNRQKSRRRGAGFAFFETFVIVAVIAVLAFLQTRSDIKNDQWLHIALIGIHIMVSGYAGHKIFPKIFRNEELVSFQEVMLGRIITILKSRNRDILSFELRELVSQTIGNIDRKVTTEFMNQQDENVRSFFDAAEGNVVIDPTKIEEHIQEAIEADQKRISPNPELKP